MEIAKTSSVVEPENQRFCLDPFDKLSFESEPGGSSLRVEDRVKSESC